MDPCNEQTFACLAKDIFDVVASGIPVLIACAVMLFFWGLVQFLSAGGSEENLKKGKNLMLWGIVGLFVMVSVWAFAELLTSTFGILFKVPQLPE